jgi:hypothetical protein
MRVFQQNLDSCKRRWIRGTGAPAHGGGASRRGIVNEDSIDENGWAILDKLRPAHYCGQAYSGDNKFRFVASYETMEVDTVYDGLEASRVQLASLGSVGK